MLLNTEPSVLGLFLKQLDVVACTCNSSTWEAEAGGLSQVCGQPYVYSKRPYLQISKINK